MITNVTEYFIEILSEDGKELYNEELDVATNRITTPLSSDLSNWIERDIIDLGISDFSIDNQIYN